ncbi:hypothetical protein [Streptomyces boninensis]|uniref:hypothetical protein n=1 Tax=Streptomyces boninensis TaxID=2039455 RepID=UPI003B21FFA1
MFGTAHIILLAYVVMALGAAALAVSAVLAVHAIRRDVRGIRRELTRLNDRLE